MTRQEKLDIINFKIARTSQSDEGTWCFLPVMAKDIAKFIQDSEWIMILDEMWAKLEDSLDKQSDDCIDYVYSLIK